MRGFDAAIFVPSCRRRKSVAIDDHRFKIRRRIGCAGHMFELFVVIFKVSDFIFEEAWEEWLQDRLTGRDDLLESVILSRIPLERTAPMGDPMTLRKLARRLIAQRDLAPHISEAAIDPRPVRDWFAQKIQRAMELIRGRPEADTLVAAVRTLAAESERAKPLDDPDLILALRSLRIKKGLGNKRLWKADEAFDECRAITQEIAERGAPSRSRCRRRRSSPSPTPPRVRQSPE